MTHNYKNKWQILFVASSSSMLVALDISALTIAIPVLEKRFSLSAVSGLWILNSYLLALLAFYLISGKLGDIFGKKRIFLLGLAVFGLGSFLAAVSSTGLWLIASRAVQGVGGALSFPTMTLLLLEGFPMNERGRAIGINTAISSAFLLIGPVVGGFFVEYLSWRYIFWINLPIIAYGLVAGAVLLPPEKTVKRPLHFFGALSSGIASSSLVIALMEGGEWGWFSFPVLGLFALSLIFAFLFFYTSKDIQDPLIDLSLFKSLWFNAANFFIFITQLTMTFNTFLAIYLQKQLDYSPFQAGLLLVIGSIPFIIFSPLGGYLGDNFSPRLPMMMGSVMLILSFGFFLLFPLNHYVVIILLVGLLLGGIATLRAPSFSWSITTVPPEHLNAAVNLTKATRQFAATFGLAIMAAVVKSSAEKASYSKGFDLLVILFLIFSLIALVISLFVTDKKQNAN